MLKVTKIPVLTVEQMQEVDRLMVNHYHIGLIQTMENAGRHLAELCRRCLNRQIEGSHIVLAVGGGNNGGGGMVAARHLSNWGATVTVIARDQRFAGVPRKQWHILTKLPLHFVSGKKAHQTLEHLKPDLFVDAMIGYGLQGKPRGFYARVIEQITGRKDFRVVSLDVPTGLDADSGTVFHPHIRADFTLTLALPKMGLFGEEARLVVGKLFLADIGVPPALYRQLGITFGALFAAGPLLDLQAPEGLSHPEISPAARQSLDKALQAGTDPHCLILE